MAFKNLEKTSIHKVHEKETTGPNNKIIAMSSASLAALDGGPISKDARRLIYLKLDETHDGEKYIEDWSDEKVAQNLGVARNWVTRIREELSFGPDTNEQTSVLDDGDNLLAKIKTEHTAMVEKCDTLRAEMMQFEGSLEKLRLTKRG